MESPPRPVILIAEDDPSIAVALSVLFEREEFKPIVARDGFAAYDLALRHRPRFIVLDWMLPGASGLAVCRRLRQDPRSALVPILMLSARIQESDTVLALDAGADDYVTKPFSPSELVARVHAVLRRVERQATRTVPETILLGDVELDAISHKVYRRGTLIELPPISFRLLHTLMRMPGRVFSRQQLLNVIWNNGAVTERTIDVHIRRLRLALRDEGRPRLIRTVRSGGYAFADERVDASRRAAWVSPPYPQSPEGMSRTTT